MILIGHRGARGLAPENTLVSIRKALDYGVDEVEMDIRVSKDNVPVLCHDSSMSTGEKWYLISRHTFSELKSLNAQLATLDEALRLIGNKAIIHIEVKHGEPVEPVVRVISSYLEQSAKTPRLLLGSKSQKVLRELHRLLPDIPKVVIEPWSGIRAVYRAKQIGTKRISMRSWWLWSGFLRYMHKKGYLIVPYTMNDPKKTAKWQPYIYGVVTDYPDRYAKSQLQEPNSTR